jgi:serine protease Do
MNSPQIHSLHDRSEALAAIVARVGASTVAVLGRRDALASGVAWRPGLVVTAAHAFRRTPAAVTLVAAGGRSLDATLVGIDSSTDIALFRLADESAVAPASLGDAEALKPGHTVVAVGRSGDGDALASQGIVNRAGGAWQTWLGGHVDRLIRLDGGVYDGLSGAPVADTQGAVVGIATAALSRSYGIVVPALTVSRVVEALLAHGRIARPWLGIGAQTVPMPNAVDRAGLLVTSLVGGGPAQKAGLMVGDILISAAGRAAADLRDLRDALATHVGQSVTLGVLRGGAPVDMQATVAEWPGEPRCC